MTLINATSLPKINDIIINSDGRFFKVKSIDEISSNIYCNLIAVSGTGGGTVGPGGEEKISITFNTTIGYRFIYGQSNFVSITPKAVTDARVNILYEVIGENNQHYSYLFENLTSG
jgi:hypothetical protein